MLVVKAKDSKPTLSSKKQACTTSSIDAQAALSTQAKQAQSGKFVAERWGPVIEGYRSVLRACLWFLITVLALFFLAALESISKDLWRNEYVKGTAILVVGALVLIGLKSYHSGCVSCAVVPPNVDLSPSDPRVNGWAKLWKWHSGLLVPLIAVNFIAKATGDKTTQLGLILIMTGYAFAAPFLLAANLKSVLLSIGSKDWVSILIVVQILSVMGGLPIALIAPVAPGPALIGSLLLIPLMLVTLIALSGTLKRLKQLVGL